MAEYDGSSQLQATYVFGPGIDEVIKVERGTTVAAYHTDGLGSVVAITEGGVVRNTYRYDAFGEPIEQGGSGPLPNAYTYTGRELDGSGLYYYRARYYLPRAGRFLTPDPIGLRGGLNAYAYVNSNPVNFTDPFGLFAGSALGPASPTLLWPTSSLFDDNAFRETVFGTADPFEQWVYSSPIFTDLGASEDWWDLATQVASGLGLAALGFVPWVGDALDVYDVLDPGSSLGDRAIGAGSLGST